MECFEWPLGVACIASKYSVSNKSANTMLLKLKITEHQTKKLIPFKKCAGKLGYVKKYTVVEWSKLAVWRFQYV